MKWTKILVMIGFAGMMLGMPSTGSSQSVMELDAIVVEGRIQRPQASYIIQRASLDFGIQAKRRSFVGKIVTTIENDPF